MKTETGGFIWQNGPEIPVRITSAFHYIRRQAGPGGRRIKHTEWVLDYAVTDHGRYRAGADPGPWSPRQAGSAHLYAPGTPYWEDITGAPLPVESAWLTFTGGEAVGLGLLAGSSGFVRFTDSGGDLKKGIVRAAALARERGEAGFRPVQGILMAMIGLLLGSSRGRDARVICSNEDIAEPVTLADAVKRYLRSRLGEKISINDIADYCHVSRSTLTHRYKRQTGETPWATLQAMRIDTARMLLMRGERLQAIAELTGFSDEYHLSKTFKKITGSAPRRYLQSNT